MLRRSWFGVVLGALAGCSSYEPQHFGTATVEAQQAFKDWCSHGRLEMETKLEGNHRSVANANPNLLVMDCYNNGADPSERGWLAFDSKTNELLDFNANVHPSTASALFERVLVPALDDKQKAALTDLLAWARTKPKEVTKRWDAGRLALVLQVYPQPDAPEPEWDIIAVLK